MKIRTLLKLVKLIKEILKLKNAGIVCKNLINNYFLHYHYSLYHYYSITVTFQHTAIPTSSAYCIHTHSSGVITMAVQRHHFEFITLAARVITIISIQMHAHSYLIGNLFKSIVSCLSIFSLEFKNEL